MKRALFPGSFDPFTLGHLEIVASASKLFDEVVVAVGYNINKPGFLQLPERLRIIEESIASLSLTNVKVDKYSGLTIEFCKKEGISYIVRGIRNGGDLEAELIIAAVNRQLAPEVETIFLPSTPEKSHITSSVVRDVYSNGGSIELFMAKGVTIKR